MKRTRGSYTNKINTVLIKFISSNRHKIEVRFFVHNYIIYRFNREYNRKINMCK